LFSGRKVREMRGNLRVDIARFGSSATLAEDRQKRDFDFALTWKGHDRVSLADILRGAMSGHRAVVGQFGFMPAEGLKQTFCATTPL
jgi:hypothetical protein